LASERGEFQLAPRAGRGDVDIAPQFRGPNTPRGDADTFVGGFSVGFRAPFGLLIEVGHEAGVEFDLFDAVDAYDFSQYYVGVGYQFELGEGWRLVPKYERARWKLRSEEGQFANPGPERVDSVTGYEHIWEVNLSRRVSDTVALGVSHRQGDYLFGRARSTTFLVTIGL
jgi:hypothetical protein